MMTSVAESHGWVPFRFHFSSRNPFTVALGTWDPTHRTTVENRPASAVLMLGNSSPWRKVVQGVIESIGRIKRGPNAPTI